MNRITATVVFWFIFAFLSSWVLRRFYFSKDKNLLWRLKVTASVLHVVVFVLFLFPWFPIMNGGFFGWELLLQGNIAMVFLTILLVFSFVILLTSQRPSLFKAGVLCHISATMLLFGFMMYTFHGTVTLTLRDTAPIFAALVLLVNNVVLLLFWHELDKRRKHQII